MSNFPTIKFNDAKIGDFLFDKNLEAIFEVVRSGDVFKASMSPDFPMMKCYFSIDNNWNEGQLIQDYFNQEFYGAFNKILADNYSTYLRNYDKQKYKR